MHSTVPVPRPQMPNPSAPAACQAGVTMAHVLGAMKEACQHEQKSCSGDPGHPAQPCRAQPGFAVRLEEAACTLQGYSFGQAWEGVSFQLFVVPLLLAATGHGKEYPPPPLFFFSGVSLVDRDF